MLAGMRPNLPWGVGTLAVRILSDVGACLRDLGPGSGGVVQNVNVFWWRGDWKDVGDHVWGIKMVWPVGCETEVTRCLNEACGRARRNGMGEKRTPQACCVSQGVSPSSSESRKER